MDLLGCLGAHIEELKDLRSANLITKAQEFTKILFANQEPEKKQVEERLIAGTAHLEEFSSTARKLEDEFKYYEEASEVALKAVDVARAALAKGKRVLEASEQRYEVAIREARKLKPAKKQVREDLSICSAFVESLKLELLARKVFTEEVLNAQAIKEVAKLHAEEICWLEQRIKELAGL